MDSDYGQGKLARVKLNSLAKWVKEGTWWYNLLPSCIVTPFTTKLFTTPTCTCTRWTFPSQHLPHLLLELNPSPDHTSPGQPLSCACMPKLLAEGEMKTKWEHKKTLPTWTWPNCVNPKTTDQPLSSLALSTSPKVKLSPAMRMRQREEERSFSPERFLPQDNSHSHTFAHWAI